MAGLTYGPLCVPLQLLPLGSASLWLTGERIPVALSLVLESLICLGEGDRDRGMACSRPGAKTVDYSQQGNCHRLSESHRAASWA